MMLDKMSYKMKFPEKNYYKKLRRKNRKKLFAN